MQVAKKKVEKKKVETRNVIKKKSTRLCNNLDKGESREDVKEALENGVVLE